MLEPRFNGPKNNGNLTATDVTFDPQIQLFLLGYIGHDRFWHQWIRATDPFKSVGAKVYVLQSFQRYNLKIATQYRHCITGTICRYDRISQNIKVYHRSSQNHRSSQYITIYHSSSQDLIITEHHRITESQTCLGMLGAPPR